MKITLQDELPVISGLLAGTDEAGRGPLAGNVVAAAVILDPAESIEGLDDSKKLSEKKRTFLATEIKQKALAWSVVSISPQQIDEMNILQASLFAMRTAAEKLKVRPAHVFVDGNKTLLNCFCGNTAIIKGDSRVAEISAASILAKVERDAQMLVLHKQYPAYGFDKHKGYPTKVHREILQKIGPCPEHRRSYAPVREATLTSDK
ncbi:Ribonuclease HII [hydrothermal vent metagenome]|uniref:Ribonuclease HII n=1 Tax=hydrothermal vent metagenome TaxID=652676 RepID=A0A3B0WRN5_9ZZZZ